MLQRKQIINLQINQFIDGLLLAFALWLAHALRYYSAAYFDFIPVRISGFGNFLWLALVILPAGPLMLELQGFYNLRINKPLLRSLSEILRAGIWLFVIIAICVIFFRLSIPSRSVLIIFAVLGTLTILARERFWLWQLRRQADDVRLREQVLLAGTQQSLADLHQSLTPETMLEMEIVGEFDVEHGATTELISLLHDKAVSRVIFSGGHAHINKIEDAISACEVEGVEVWLLADFVNTKVARPALEMLNGRPMLVFRSTPEFSWSLMIKAILDRILAFIMLILLIPVMVFAAIGIKLTSPGPVFFRQLRGGRYGKPFEMWKFRSMQTNAEMRRAELEAFNEMSGPVFKVKDDPRITKFGAFLRKTSIDELPQLLNVLRGEMSLVGPRPLPLYEVAKIEAGPQRRRLSVKPGLTCLWQISGRNEVSEFSEWVRLDLEYIDSWSLLLDIKILLKTIPVVLGGLGAK